MISTWRVMGLLGQGGFGRVYLVRRSGPEGWERDVAVKLLDPARSDPGSLRRLRDEARILALVRDRAVVAAEPPMKLGESWAVVMEYVAGRSLGELLEDGHRPPVAAALELVEEVARALGHLGEATTSQGLPLGLVHRDLKPANLQMTRAGEVKILDFGIARANLPDREASTTRAIVGTPGYLAPERLLGQDGPAGDIYALGVILGRLTGCFDVAAASTMADPAAVQPSSSGGAGGPADGPSDGVAELARAMTAWSAGERPVAREVERRARELRQRMTGPGLREWCERVVPAERTLDLDELTGKVFDEAGAPRRRWAVLVGGGLALVVLGLALWSRPAAREEVGPEELAPVVEGGGVPLPAPPVLSAAAPSVPTPPAREPPAATRPEARRPVVAPAPVVAEPPPPAPPVEVAAAPAPEPVAPPPPSTARVSVRGDAERVVLVRGGQRVTLPAEVAEGGWQVEVTFPGRPPFMTGRSVEARAGKALELNCALRFNGCSAGP